MDVNSDVTFSPDAALSPSEQSAVRQVQIAEQTTRRQRHRRSPREPDGGAAPQSPALLTPREWEVLCLLTLRLSDPEIGHRLFIGTRTVETHVANIRAKLGAANRREAIALAAVGGHPLPNHE